MPTNNIRSEVLAEFLKTRDKSNDEDEYYRSLVSLRPDHLSIHQIAEIVKWVEITKKTMPTLDPHINIFGTGGDGTINVSTMAAIIASHFADIVKVGTPGVTSQWGSSDFIIALQQYLRTKSARNQTVHPFMWWGGGSKYIALSKFGFPYNAVLRKARIRLKDSGIPDIYKVVFPFANYTQPIVQINGVSSPTYRNIYIKLAEFLSRKIWIVESEHSIDELMPGRNKVSLTEAEGTVEMAWSFEEENSNRAKRIFAEPNRIDDCISIFESLFSCPGDDSSQDTTVIRETVVQNAALILTSFQIAKGANKTFSILQEVNRNRIYSQITNL